MQPTWEDVYSAALARVTHAGQAVPFYQEPADATNETFITFNDALAQMTLPASNVPHRVRHMVQVHVYTLDASILTQLANDVVDSLMASGILIRSWGPRIYDAHTGYTHYVITTYYIEKLRG